MTGQRLENSQKLGVIPTQRMQFALTVLAMPYHEMETRLREDLQDNILLEESAPDNDELHVERTSDEYYTARSRKGTGDRRKKDPEDGNWMECQSAPVTLGMILEQQAGENFEREDEREVARWIVGNLNEKGYLTMALDELAEAGGFSPEMVEHVRQRLMRFTPTGCGASGLGECLAVQALERWGPHAWDLARTLQHTPRRLLSPPYAERTARRLGMKNREHLFQELRRLDPAPGLRYAPETPYHPPVDIRFHEEDGKWTVHINAPDMEGWRLRPEYHPEQLDSSTRRFLMPYVQNLRFWRYALRLRRDTLRQMAEWLLKYQMEFVRHGPRRLEPFTMTNAAEHLGVSVSTVSRCVQNKTLHFAWGTFPFRDVFRDIRVQRAENRDIVTGDAGDLSGMTRKAGEKTAAWNWSVPYFPGMDVTAGSNGSHGGEPESGQEPVTQLHEHVVREALLQILREESIDCVYPDEILARKLKEQGIPVSRRCLAGYRQRWGIGHRGERLMQFRLAGDGRKACEPHGRPGARFENRPGKHPKERPKPSTQYNHGKQSVHQSSHDPDDCS